MIIIDSDKYGASGIETMFFPGGEPHVKVPDFDRRNKVLPFLKLRTWNDVGFAALVMDALQRQGVSIYPFIPYLPGARQDRSDGSAALTLAVVGSLLDHEMTRSIYAFDTHSAASHNYVCIAQEFMPADLLPARREGVAGIIAPDAGALERATHFRDAIYPDRPVYTCEKQRDAHTGRLSNYVMPRLDNLGHYIVVDDICDGGGTFNLLAEAFAADRVGVKSTLELLVSHGIFSKGLDAISPLYTHITTTDSWCRLPSGGRLKVLPLAPLFPLITGEQQ